MASLNDVKTRFEGVNTANIDELIDTIKTLLKRSKAEKMPSKWNSFIESGATFLSFINQQKGRFGETVDLFKSGGQVLGVISGILEEVGKTHWAIAGLSLIGHLLTRRVQMSENQNECMQLLQYMVDLADHINNLRLLVRQEAEKLKNALVIIVKGSMLCAKQLDSKKLFRFLKSSLDSKNLSSLRAEINVLYPDLQLTAVIAILQQQAQRLPMRKPDYPADAGGIIRVAMRNADESTLVKIFYFGDNNIKNHFL